jgi:mycoketide-CoA synthase
MTAAPRNLESVRQWLEETIARVLGVAEIDPRVRFRELGLSSRQMTELVSQLSEYLGYALPATAPWEHPTPGALARHIVDMTVTTRPNGAPGATPLGRGAVALGGHEPIAVVGMACRLPGGVGSPEEFWTLLREGRHGIREVPAARWNMDGLFHEDATSPGTMNTRWGGFIDDVDRFDPAFFGISPREARQIDPQQRLVLELAWQALEDAGVAPLSLRDAAVGVYVGAMGSDYATLTSGRLGLIDQHTAPGVDTSIISARVSYQLGLRGPSVTINTACSSSLVAVHLACQSLRLGESTMALVGGVHLILSPHGTVAMTKFGAMNPAGQCRSFDASANGYVRGEGAGIVVLKPLGRAIADGDRIYCVIRGSATNNDGFSNGLTAPSPRAQEAMLAQACAVAAVDPGSGHDPRRPDRGGRAGGCVGLAPFCGSTAAYRVGQDELGASGARGRNRRPDEGRAVAASWLPAGQPQFRGAERAHPVPGLALEGANGARGISPRAGSGAGRREFVWLWRRQLSCRSRGDPGQPGARPPAFG